MLFYIHVALVCSLIPVEEHVCIGVEHLAYTGEVSTLVSEVHAHCGRLPSVLELPTSVTDRHRYLDKVSIATCRSVITSGPVSLYYCMARKLLCHLNPLPTNDALMRHDLCELSISLWEFIWGF